MTPAGEVSGRVKDKRQLGRAGSVNFEGIIFPHKAGGWEIVLNQDWELKGEAYNPARCYKRENMVVITGVVQPKDRNFDNWQPLIGTLPVQCRPSDGSLVFSVNSGDDAHEVEISQSGAIVWKSGNHRTRWLSLDGVAFLRSTFNQLLLESPSWRSLSSVHPDLRYRTPGYGRLKRYCFLTGMILVEDIANVSSTVAHLPADECAPPVKVRFTVNNHDSVVGMTVPITFALVLFSSYLCAPFCGS